MEFISYSTISSPWSYDWQMTPPFPLAFLPWTCLVNKFCSHDQGQGDGLSWYIETIYTFNAYMLDSTEIKDFQLAKIVR